MKQERRPAANQATVLAKTFVLTGIIAVGKIFAKMVSGYKFKRTELYLVSFISVRFLVNDNVWGLIP